MTVLNLGKLELPKEKWKSLADRIEQIVSGQKRIIHVGPDIEELAQHYAPLVVKKKIEITTYKEEEEQEVEYRSVDLKSVEQEVVRPIGAEYVGLEYFRKLKMDQVLRGLGLTEKQIQIAALLIVGRLVQPSSERATVEWAKYISGLNELLGTQFKQLSHNAVYRMSDKLFEHKEEIEEALRDQEKGLFSLEEKIILYDLTNTYFEGSKYEESDIEYGKSKDKRGDCPLLALGMVIDEYGFTKRSEFFPGNVSEPDTLEEMVKKLGGKKGSTVVIDAGIATEKNLKMLKGKGYEYVCVARGKPVSGEEEEAEEGMIMIKEEKDNKIEAKLVKGKEEWILICESKQRRAKEQSMKESFERRFEEGLEAIKGSLQKKGGTKRYEKVLERIGRLKERSHGIHQYYDIKVTQKDGIATDITYRYERREEAEERYSGKYYIRTSRKDLNEQEIWSLYITLSGVEDSFRSIKSELGIRPVYHYKGRRIKGHIFISVLAYHLLNAIRFRLRAHRYFIRWSTVRKRLSTHVASTITMRTEDGKRVYIRTVSKPEIFHRDIYRALGLKAMPIRRRKVEV